MKLSKMHIIEGLLNQGLNPDLVGPTSVEFPQIEFTRESRKSHILSQL